MELLRLTRPSLMAAPMMSACWLDPARKQWDAFCGSIRELLQRLSLALLLIVATTIGRGSTAGARQILTEHISHHPAQLVLPQPSIPIPRGDGNILQRGQTV